MSQMETQVQGTEIPAGSTWNVDPAHSNVGFIARYVMLSKVRGKFGTFAGTILTLVFLPAMYSIWFKIRPATVANPLRPSRNEQTQPAGKVLPYSTSDREAEMADG